MTDKNIDHALEEFKIEVASLKTGFFFLVSELIRSEALSRNNSIEWLESFRANVIDLIEKSNPDNHTVFQNRVKEHTIVMVGTAVELAKNQIEGKG
jgi:hypothetical protein